MANENTAYAVPDFKVARVGKERKKRSGFAWFKGPVKPGAWTGATGGAGAGGVSGVTGVLGMSFKQFMLAVIATSAVGGSAVYMGQRDAARQAVMGAQTEKPSVFAKPEPIKFEGDTSNLPSTANSMPNSLGYVSGSADGLTPEERAKLAAEAEAKKQAEDEAARKAEEEAAAKDQPAPNPMDPAAMMAGAQEGADRKGSAFGKKFGALSSSFGGQSSLSGGAGLSGGVARNFGSGPGGPRGQGGQLGNMGGVGSRVKMANASRARVSPSNVKGFARRQLANANALSRRGMAAGRGETASYDASSAFDNNDGAGNVITGAGINNGAGAGAGKADTPNALNSGGPAGDGSVAGDCGNSAYYDANSGGCVPLKAPKKQSANKAVDTMAMIAQIMLATIGVLAIVATAIYAAAGTVVLTGAALTAMQAIAIAIFALAAIITLLGIAIMAMGDFLQGTVFTLVGGFITLSSLGYVFPPLTTGTAIVASAAGSLLAQAAKMLKPAAQ